MAGVRVPQTVCYSLNVITDLVMLSRPRQMAGVYGRYVCQRLTRAAARWTLPIWAADNLLTAVQLFVKMKNENKNERQGGVLTWSMTGTR